MHDSMNSTLFCCCWVLFLNFCWTVSLVARAISSHYYNIVIMINISCSRYLLDRQSMHAGHWPVQLAYANSVPNKFFSILFCVWLVTGCAVRIKMKIQSCIPTIWWIWRMRRIGKKRNRWIGFCLFFDLSPHSNSVHLSNASSRYILMAIVRSRTRDQRPATKFLYSFDVDSENVTKIFTHIICFGISAHLHI